MAVTSTTGTNAVEQLAQSLMNRFDANKDGKLSANEFSSFVGQLMGLFGGGTDLERIPEEPLKFEGFDFSRAQNPERSAKDAFAKLAREAGSMPKTKDQAEAWFNSHIKSSFEALGHRVNWVKGDKCSFTNWQGTFTVDFIRGADGPDPAFWWGADRSSASLT